MVSERFKEAYWKFRNREIVSMREMGIFLGHSAYYHKCIYKFSEEYEKSPEYQEDLKKHMDENPYMRGSITDKKCFKEKSRGRRGEKGITDAFKEVYWRYENYEISPQEAFLASGYSKNWFHKVSLDYEASPYYEAELLQHPSVMDKPHRTRAVPEGFREDMGVLTDAQLCEKYRICQAGVNRMRLKTDKKNVWKFIQLPQRKKNTDA